MNIFATYNADDIVRVGVALVIFFSVFLAIIYAVWGGFLLVISGGKEENVKKAINHIRYAALGVIVLIAIIFIMPIFLGLFGLSGYVDFFRPNTILATIQDITAQIFSGGSVAPLLDTTGQGLPSNFTDL